MANFWENDKVVESPTENFWEKDAIVGQKAAPAQAVADPNQGDFMRAVTNYLPGIQETYGGAKVLAGNVLGNKEMVESGVGHMKAGQAKQVAKETDEFTNAWEKGIGTVLTDWLPYQVGSGVMSMAEILASMGVGAGVGAVTGAGVGAVPGALTGALGKTLLKKGVKEIAEDILKNKGKEDAEKYIQDQAKSALVSMGKTAGIAGSSILHGTGEVTNRAVDELEKQGKGADQLDLTRVLPAAAVHSVADFVSDKITLGALKGMTEGAKKGLVYEVTKQIGVLGAKETIPEEIQTIAERYGASLSLSDAEALKDYINTAAAAVGMSVVPGGIGGVRTHLANKLEDKVETDKENIDKKREFNNVEKAAEELQQPDPTLAAGMAPKFDLETGEPIAVSATATPPVKEETAVTPSITPETTEVVQQTIAPGATPESIYEVPKKEAGDYLTAIESQTVKPNASILKKHIKALGIEVPAGAGFTERAIEAIKGQLAQGAQNVIQPTDTGTSGASAEVLGGPNPNGTPAGVTNVGLGRPGMGSNQSIESAPQNREGVQQPTLERPSTITPEEMQAGLERDQAQAAQAEVDRQAALQEVAGKQIPQTKTGEDVREEYELSRQAMGELGFVVPEWDKLTSDERDKYLGTLTTNPSAQDFDNAAKTLAAYREQKKGTGVKPGAQRVINGYEESRPAYQRSLGMDLPAWNELTPEAQTAYTNNVKNNTVVEQDAGFNAVADQLEQEGTSIRGVSRAGMEQLKLKASEQSAQTRAQEELAKSLADRAQAVGKGKPLSNGLIMMLLTGDVNGVLKQLGGVKAQGLDIGPQKGERGVVKAAAERQSILTKLVSKFLAQALNTIKYNSNVVVADMNNEVIQRLEREGKLAEYDPKTDTFYFTEKGLDEATFLHEVVHAGTVKLIHQYLTNPSSLSANQRKALDHLQTIFNFSKNRLGGKFKNAYENLYEFVGYALTDSRFQDALANMQVRPLAKYTTQAQDLWKQFTQVLADLYGLVTAKARAMELRPEIFDAFAKSLAPMNKEGLYEATTEEEGVTTLEGEIATETDYAQRGAETELKEKKQKYKPGKAFLSVQPGYEGNLLLEVTEAFRDILEAPEAGIEVAPLAAKKAEKAPARVATFNDPGKEYMPSDVLAPKNARWFKERFLTRPGWRKIFTEFQNDRYPIKHWEDVLELAGKIAHGVNEKFNNIYTQLTLATSAASNFYKTYVAQPVEALDTAIMEYAKAAGVSTDEVLAKLHVLFEALHEPERRRVKYLMNVPLKDAAADRRKEILDLIRKNNKITPSEAQALRKELDAVVNNKKNLDTASKKSTDMANDEYNVLGIDQAAARISEEQYKNDPNKALLDNILDQVKTLNDVTAELNKIANYWSQPVTNIVNFYGWNYYTPFKGKKYSRHGDADELLDFDSAKNGKELQEIAYTFEGRESVAENPMLQVLADASRAAARAGRRNLTMSILNAITPNAEGKKLLEGSVVQTIKFEDRYNTDNILKDVKRENTVFHYKEDGSIDIIEINDKKLREAIRRTYKDSNPMVDVANTITSKLGQLHTRYNYNFAPMNFVRDALTNAWTIGADMGPAASARFIKEITGSVAKGGLAKAMKVAHLLQKNDIASIQKLAETDPGYKDMVDYIRHGGMVSYLQSLTTKSNFEQIQKRLGRNKIAKTKEQLDIIVDTWTDMFEITSRAAAFGIAKRAAIESNIAKGMSPKDAEDAANIKAAGYAKNLANFEQVGEYGKVMGAFYMFFRPSATGAVRAIEAVAPAFNSVSKAVTSLPPHIQNPQNEADAKALADFKAAYAQKQQNARIMVTALMGLGALAYTMSAMMAPDDDLGRNKLMTDNMDQWTRFWRLHVPGLETPIQIPWGFGLGSFAAAGAQLASVVSGHQPASKALSNVFLQVSLDSFVPIPVSRMPPADNPLAFAVDSVAPSTVRPVIEFLINKNGLGQDIYNSASGRRMGDAFLGGDKIPEMYKNAAAAMWDATNGVIDISPNTMYFLSNSYVDGPSRVFEGVFGITDTVTGRKEFTAKTDLPLIGSFFGAEANVDSREFASIKKEIELKAGRVKAAKLEPARYVRYTEANPFDELLVDVYNKDIVELNNLNKEANEIRLDHNMTPKEKQELIKVLNLQQNIIKRNLIEQYKAYGVEP
jgi:hypothetical protein